MNVLFIGDVVSEPGCECVRKNLNNLKSQYSINLTIANGENSAKGNGLSKNSAEYLFSSGVDIITGGNHIFKRQDVYSLLDESNYIIRPANYPKVSPGKGVCEFDLGYTQVSIINLIGQAFMQPSNSPFETVDEILKKIENKIIIVDFHAESTGEKGAIGYYLDGRVSAVIGTHTHVQTNDNKILPNGTGFITDVGMVGPKESILGVHPKDIIDKMSTQTTIYFSVKDAPSKFCGVVLQIDDKTGKCNKIEKINIE